MSAEQITHAPAPPVIQKQISLPWSKAWQISIKSIKIRLARSLITAAGIFLGIAFYSSVRSAALYPVVISNTMTDEQKKEVLAALHRQQWLAVMALIVCFVGITNSMLMSVTERFREIGTMKCLGALNSFVVKLFFIEAALMGFLASILGWLAGWFIIFIIHVFGDGPGVAFQHAFSLEAMTQGIISVVIGAGITLIAAVPPANKAAQMPPAAALRSTI